LPNTDIRILEIEPYYLNEKARSPLKFGAVVMDVVTFCHVRARVENRRGQVADGWGAIFLSDFWAFPTPHIAHEIKDVAMRRVTDTFCQLASDYKTFAHPIDIFLDLEKSLRGISERVCREMNLAEPMPFLGALVCASPVDAAIHDAFGVVNGISSYAGYGREFVSHDLSAHLGDAFRGRYLDEFVRVEPSPTVPIFHLVGGLDTLRESEVSPDAPRDGRPNSLEKWIEQDGVFCLKVKLRGTDLDWDLNRTLDVFHIARERLPKFHLTADTNEQCTSPAYMVELLNRLREKSRAAYDALLYVEQPTERDLTAHRFDMRELAALKPVIIDESLTGLDEMTLALDLGWSGVALKSCKCTSIELLIAARAQAAGIPYTIQDLTNPGLALLHSVGLGAHLSPMMGVEANSRQYYPDTSAPESRVHPEIVNVRNGVARTETLRGVGLGYQVEKINREIFSVEK
jgi:L-alanine-DL-glutamate epimerase-like enolase superfamily enzyme